MTKTAKIIGRSVLVFFTVIIVSCAGLYLFSAYSAKKNTDENTDAAVFIGEILTASYPGQQEQLSDVRMPVINFDGTDYSALLDIQAHSVHIPVRSSWQNQFSDPSPCRFRGSCYDGSLIIGGADFKGQFDFISDIDIGEKVTVTDMTGAVFTFTVDAVRHSKDIDNDLKKSGEYDLLLFSNSRRSHDHIIVCCAHQS